MVWGWQIQFVISTALVCIWLLVIVRERLPLRPKIAVTVGLTVVLLPLSGANGLLLTPFVALWLAAGTLHRRDKTARWIAPFQIGCVIVSIALVGLYFVGFVRPAWAPLNPGFWPTVKTGAKLVGMVFGPVGGGKVHPGWITGLACGAASLLLASSIIPLWRGLGANRTSERPRVFGLLIFETAMAALVVAVAWGRAGSVPRFGMPDRYALLGVPALCVVYFAWILYGPQIVRDRIAITFVIAMLVALPFNLRQGRAWRDWYVTGMQSFEQDLSDGLSWQELGDRHHEFLLRWDREALIERLRMLYEAKTGPLGRATPR